MELSKERVVGLTVKLVVLIAIASLSACAGTSGAPVQNATPAPATTPVTASATQVATPGPTLAVPPTGAATASQPSGAEPGPAATAAVGPTAAPAAGARIAIQAPDNSIQFVDPEGGKTTVAQLTAPVDLASTMPPGNVLSTTLYLALNARNAVVFRVDANGAQNIAAIALPVTGIAAGGARLAWGTTTGDGSSTTSELFVGKPDGSQAQPVLKETFSGISQVFKPLRWSQDGTRLYFSKDPTGLGGYILFGGWTNLWSYDVASDRATELVRAPLPNAAVCMDDLSPNEALVADHCNLKTIEVFNLANQQRMRINAPASVTTYGALGSARFSPDSSRLAFALARRDPDAEQGWVAVSDGLTGTSRLVATSPAGDYFSVAAWLDSDMLLLQSAGNKPGVWTVGTDGSNLTRIADGTFVGLLAGMPGAGVASAPTGSSAATPAAGVTPTGSTVVAPAATASTPSPAASPTSRAPVTSPDGPCSYKAIFLGDVTVPDNTQVPAGKAFTKTWRVRNDGTCTWGAGGYALHSLVATGAERLGALDAVEIPVEVPPGSTVDLSVPMVAPSVAGPVRSEWKLKVDNGPLVGFGTDGQRPLYVLINVTTP